MRGSTGMRSEPVLDVLFRVTSGHQTALAFDGYVLIRSLNLPTLEAFAADQGAAMPDPSSFDAVVTIIKIGFVVIPLLMVFAIIGAIIYARGGARSCGTPDSAR